MSDKVLMTPAELFEQLKSPGMVLIDTRDPKSLRGRSSAGRRQHPRHFHLSGDVDAGRCGGNARQVRRDLRRGRSVRQRNRGGVRAVDGYRLRPILPRLRTAALSRLPEGHDPARRLCGVAKGQPADHDGRPEAAAEDLPDRSEGRKHSGRSTGHEGGRRRSQPDQARHPRRRRVDRATVRRPMARTFARARAASRAPYGSNGTA